MKKRYGFVSNSSTSSFICDVCGGIEAGYDLCLKDADMTCCEHNHCWHNSCYVTDEIKIEENFIFSKFKEWAQEEYHLEYYQEYCEQINGANSFDELEELNLYSEIYDELFYEYEFPAELCPFCKLEKITERDALVFLMKNYGFRNFDDVTKHVSSEFKSYDEFQKFIRG